MRQVKAWNTASRAMRLGQALLVALALGSASTALAQQDASPDGQVPLPDSAPPQGQQMPASPQASPQAMAPQPQGPLQPGEGFVTRFSGIAAATSPGTAPSLDP